MPEYLSPGVYVEEVETGAMPIEGVSTSTAGFLGETERGPTDPKFLTSFADFRRTFGGFALYREGKRLAGTHLAYAVDGFFRNGGTRCYVGRVTAETATAEATLGAFGGRRELAVPADPLDFGTVVVGGETTETVRFTNRGGDEPITLSAVEITGLGADTDPDEFTTGVRPGELVTVDPGESVDVEVTLEPADAAAKSATLRLSHDGTTPASPVEVDLEGDAIASSSGDLAASPASVDFGTVPAGERVAAEVAFTNLGVADTDPTIDLADVAVTDLGTDTVAGEFAVEAVDRTVDPGETATVEVTFAPADVATKSATLSVTHTGTDPPTTVEVDLDGEGSARSQSVDIAPGDVDFGGVAVGNGVSRTVVVTNDGSDADPDVTVTGVAVTNLGPDTATDEFTTDLGPGGTLTVSPGESAEIEVTFDPEVAAEKSATLAVTHDLTTPATTVDVDLTGEGVDAVLGVEAVGPGPWGGHVAAVVEDGTLYRPGENDLFKLTLRYWSTAAAAALARAHGADPEEEDVPVPDVEEVYDNLSPDEAASDYYVDRVNDRSDLVDLARVAPGRPSNSQGNPTWLGGSFATDAETPEDVGLGDYEGDATAAPGERTGLAAFREIDDISIVTVPDESADEGVTDSVVNHCETLKDRFAVLQAAERDDPVAELAPPVDSKYAAFYYPWVTVVDPETNSRKLVPPGGHVAGIYARSDTERGVHKAPANEVVRGVRELQFDLTKAEQDVLNPKGVNCIRSFPGRGIRVWGARTTSSSALWKYVNVRRLFLYVEESIDEGTQWAVFEPNDQRLWARVRQSVSNFLTTTWRDGALVGTTPEEAFYVKADRSTMTQDDIDNGRLVVEVGIAPVKPAEFVIFRITQRTGGEEGGS